MIGTAFHQTGMRERAYIAGVVANTLERTVSWIQDPKNLNPRTAMPRVGVTEADAPDITAYLLSLRAPRPFLQRVLAVISCRRKPPGPRRPHRRPIVG